MALERSFTHPEAEEPLQVSSPVQHLAPGWFAAKGTDPSGWQEVWESPVFHLWYRKASSKTGCCSNKAANPLPKGLTNADARKPASGRSLTRDETDTEGKSFCPLHPTQRVRKPSAVALTQHHNAAAAGNTWDGPGQPSRVGRFSGRAEREAEGREATSPGIWAAASMVTRETGGRQQGPGSPGG